MSFIQADSREPGVPRKAPRSPGLPLLGPLLHMRYRALNLFERMEPMGDVVEMPFPSEKAYAVFAPPLLRRVLVDHHKNYGKQTRGYDAMRLVLGNGLLTSEGDFWKRQRRIAQPVFHPTNLHRFDGVMTDAVAQMLEDWHRRPAGERVDLEHEMMNLALTIVGKSLFDTDLSRDSARIDRALAIALQEMINRVTSPLTVPLRLPWPGNIRLRRAKRDLDDVIRGILEERRRSTADHEDFLALLMRARDEETGEGMSEAQLHDELMTLVLAGHETTANALTWTLYLLSQHPQHVAPLRQEVRRVLGDAAAPRAGDLAELHLTEAALKEGMRLYPPAWLIARSVAEDDLLGGVSIPGGSIVFIAAWAIHRSARWWSRPLEFLPERFLPGAPEPPRFAYLPFGGGPRICMGAGFAMMEAKLALAMMIRAFDFELDPRARIEPHPVITLRPKYGMPMRLRRAV